jgi:hypothetical protein
MTSLAMKSEILQHLNRLPSSMQCQVLQFARSLELTACSGVTGSTFATFAGSIPQADLIVMSQAVEQGCEKVDLHEWQLSA